MLSFRVLPVATAMGVSRIVVPRSVFPPCCQESTFSTASSMIFPMPTSAKLSFPSAIWIPFVVAVLKLGAIATADARKCSYVVLWKLAFLWMFPGFGVLISSRIASCRQAVVCSAMAVFEVLCMDVSGMFLVQSFISVV